MRTCLSLYPLAKRRVQHCAGANKTRHKHSLNVCGARMFSNLHALSASFLAAALVLPLFVSNNLHSTSRPSSAYLLFALPHVSLVGIEMLETVRLGTFFSPLSSRSRLLHERSQHRQAVNRRRTKSRSRSRTVPPRVSLVSSPRTLHDRSSIPSCRMSFNPSSRNVS